MLTKINLKCTRCAKHI